MLIETLLNPFREPNSTKQRVSEKFLTQDFNINSFPCYIYDTVPSLCSKMYTVSNLERTFFADYFVCGII
jgi:hypothetical protein